MLVSQEQLIRASRPPEPSKIKIDADTKRNPPLQETERFSFDGFIVKELRSLDSRNAIITEEDKWKIVSDYPPVEAVNLFEE